MDEDKLAAIVPTIEGHYLSREELLAFLRTLEDGQLVLIAYLDEDGTIQPLRRDLLTADK